MRRVFIYVNGILTFPGRSSNWTGRAVTATHLLTQARAEKVEYLSFPTLTRLLGQRRRVNRLIRTIGFYRGWKITLVGHSNGAAVITDALKRLDWCPIDEVILFSPACDADMERNGLAAALRGGRLNRVRIYIAGRDRALRLALSLLGRLCGYGSLGFTGPRNFVSSAVQVFEKPSWRHSEWWTDTNFPWTMGEILRRELALNPGIQ